MAEVVSIHTASERSGPAQALAEAEVVTDYGIAGDWRSHPRNTRQLTLIEEEGLLASGSRLGLTIPPGASRRQVVVRGVSLNATLGKNVRLGQVVVEVTDLCDPCANMERTIGPGARLAMATRGGICARVLEGGTLRVGDQVVIET
ncbi:MAG TPA: MOSC domain-containing protein [Candidatus Dormibacteraeota bacterium]|nr:MOSC domain-containing protein [Candidatus Dormibacteraeota bacterium]